VALRSRDPGGETGPGTTDGGDSPDVHTFRPPSEMPLAVVGLSHHTAPVEVRERLVFDRPEAARALATLRAEAGIQEAVLLSTCNRTELYLFPEPDPEALSLARGILGRRAGTIHDLDQYLYRRGGEEAVRHLFLVSAGLDSMVLGEAEIQGQVREAFETAVAVRSEPPVVGPVLQRLFEMALSVGGRVRSETRVGEGTASVASVAVELAGKIFGSLKGRRVAVLGAGSTAERTVEALGRAGVRGVLVANRTRERAETLASMVGGEGFSLDDLTSVLRSADIVVSSTSSSEPILTRATLGRAFPRGVDRPLLLVDIALPRDVAPEVGELPNVFLYNVDDLGEIVDEHLQRRREALPAARRIVGEQEAEFFRWYLARGAGPVIRSLRDRAEMVRESETARLLRRLEHLSPEDRARVEEFSRRLLNKLLHDPTTRLRDGVVRGDGAELVGTVRYLYGLDAEETGEFPDLGPQQPRKGVE